MSRLRINVTHFSNKKNTILYQNLSLSSRRGLTSLTRVGCVWHTDYLKGEPAARVFFWVSNKRRQIAMHPLMI